MLNQKTELKILQRAEEAVRRAEARARSFYAIEFPDAEVDFSLRGRCAGQARVTRSGKTCLRINPILLKENLDDFLTHTIPHEVAHLVVNWQSRNKRQRPRPHGPEWQAVMQSCFGLEPRRCHNYRTTPARVVPRSFLYSCNCRDHLLTRIMHNKISRSYQAFCKVCGTPLKFIARQEA